LRSIGIKPRIIPKSLGCGPELSRWQKRHNALIAPVRAAVEGVFATLKRWRAYEAVLYRGLATNTAELTMLALP
jgi:transposase, IS5 family